MKFLEVLVVAPVVLVLFAPVAGATESSTPPNPSFAAPSTYATGKAPSAVVIGDVNGDRRLDLATGNLGTISVLLNKGGGRFSARRDYRTGGTAFVAIGDLNGDGKLDLATPNELLAGKVFVLLNRGDGTFGATKEYPTGRGPQSVAIGDLNADGSLDLVTVNLYDENLSVLVNAGDGTFVSRQDYRTGDDPQSVAIGDVNSDGHPDVATANDSIPDTVSVLLNKGDGTFGVSRDYRTGSGPDPVVIGDVSGDGKADLVTANSDEPGNSVSVLLNRGDGTFAARRDYRTGAIPGSVVIADVNRDGKPDLAAPTAEDVSVLTNRGGGAFEVSRAYPPADASSIVAGDINGDRKLDLAAAATTKNTLSVLINRPGLCTVQVVVGKTLAAAKSTLARVGCGIGKIRRADSRGVRKGRVMSQKPTALTVLRKGGKVNVVVSRGRRQ